MQAPLSALDVLGARPRSSLCGAGIDLFAAAAELDLDLGDQRAVIAAAVMSAAACSWSSPTSATTAIAAAAELAGVYQAGDLGVLLVELDLGNPARSPADHHLAPAVRRPIESPLFQLSLCGLV